MLLAARPLSIMGQGFEITIGEEENALITPLRKRRADGTLYTRVPEIEAELIELATLTHDALVARCRIRPSNAHGYVRSECVLHFVRARTGGSEAEFGRLYKILAERVLKRLPRAESADEKTASMAASRIREQAFDRFVELVIADRATYSENLDYYEIRFDGAVVNLKRDAQKQVWREANRSTSLHFDDEIGEPTFEVEQAVGHYDPFDPSEVDAARYRSRLDAAIDALPPDQRRIVEMIRQGIPIDSKEPGAMTVAKALQKSEKTIRTYRDKAYAVLRMTLTQGQRS